MWQEFPKALYHGLNALLPQPFTPISTSLLHLLWAPPGYITQLSGRLSVLWLAGNLAISVLLAQLHSHLSLSSLRLSAVILGLWNLCNESMEGLEYIGSALEPYGKSVPRSTPPALPPQLCPPILAAPRCTQCSPHLY
jgi:hypothetical protein